MDDKAVWDDSALVDSWNEALEEYKKYHSIHAKGGSVKDLIAEESSRAKATASEIGNHVGDQKASALPDDEEGEAMSVSDEKSGKDARAGKADPALHDGTNQVPVAFPPQAVMGSIQDESLKRLMMAWYYAGYYTGLYEGQQKSQQQHQE
ncbi:survival motor neuron protein (SMN) domain-containing protein [Purpureocillium lilacinum]|uniref:Survival motor neuron protein (SMN) domain-containing protein n=2 Tax=Purpureocillium lilacinum TaxID=33203 RepID=A0A179GXY1_PURLI|nr:survival motor neuron protein (SMN) domain-containing protein [Purpureocillium lilacinum]OAQ81989.1 survival motor neuron protein (SMN) domain-containing protein [Purpureocillium lilacinum]OAQ92044.1 survival motor neuron protein (SMN) domain-containing protein [Purpureocillium lilacinum]